MIDKNIKINLPTDVEFVLNTLNKNGYEAYVVGGCVRDSLLNRPIHDWDITTNALPKEIEKLFDKTIPTGIKHGTITVMINDVGYEITTYRIDKKCDGRYAEVEFTNSLKEDLSRRDFTINAMAYSSKEGIIDYFGAMEDLNNKVIKCVGWAIERFKEDYLRVLRAIRFCVQLGFRIDKSVLFDLLLSMNNIENISVERRREEFNKIITSFNRLYFNEKWITNLFDIFDLGELKGVYQNNIYHVYDVSLHSIVSMTCVDTLELKLAMLLHDIGKKKCKTTDKDGINHFYGHAKVSKEIAEKWLTKYKYDNKTKNTVLTLIENHDITFNPTKKFVKRMLNKFREDIFRKLILVRKADILAQNPQFTLKRLDKVFKIEKILDEVIKDSECFKLKDLVVDGYDMIKLGFKGEEIGKALNLCLKSVMCGLNPNKRFFIINWINEKILLDTNNIKGDLDYKFNYWDNAIENYDRC